MHDEAHRDSVSGEPALAAVLRALPDATPPHDGWERLAARITHRRRTRTMLRMAVPAALAAGVAIAVAVPNLRSTQSPPSALRVAQQTFARRDASAPDLDRLRTQSRRLQAWVSTLDRNGAPLNGDALAGAVALQNRIGLVDLQLSAATDPATRASLWQERNALLQQLGLLHLRPYTVAERTRSDANTIVL